jgi:hypothetical protein
MIRRRRRQITYPARGGVKPTHPHAHRAFPPYTAGMAPQAHAPTHHAPQEALEHSQS